MLAFLADNTQQGVLSVFLVKDLFDVGIEHSYEGLSDGLTRVHTCQHAEELFIRNEEIAREGSSLLLKVFIEPLLDLFDGDVDLGDLLDHAPTAIQPSGLIGDLLVE